MNRRRQGQGLQVHGKTGIVVGTGKAFGLVSHADIVVAPRRGVAEIAEVVRAQGGRVLDRKSVV